MSEVPLYGVCLCSLGQVGIGGVVLRVAVYMVGWPSTSEFPTLRTGLPP